MGWTNPFEKYARQIGNLPKVGVKINHISNHHLDKHEKHEQNSSTLWELKYPFPTVEDDVPFPVWWDMLVPWRVCPVGCQVAPWTIRRRLDFKHVKTSIPTQLTHTQILQHQHETTTKNSQQKTSGNRLCHVFVQDGPFYWILFFKLGKIWIHTFWAIKNSGQLYCTVNP